MHISPKHDEDNKIDNGNGGDDENSNDDDYKDKIEQNAA